MWFAHPCRTSLTAHCHPEASIDTAEIPHIACSATAPDADAVVRVDDELSIFIISHIHVLVESQMIGLSIFLVQSVVPIVPDC